MKNLFLVCVIVFLMLSGCEKPIKIEKISGIVVSVKGNYNPLECRLVVKFEDSSLYTKYYITNFYTDDSNDLYVNCRKALFLSEGDNISAIKETWADGQITYSLNL